MNACPWHSSAGLESRRRRGFTLGTPANLIPGKSPAPALNRARAKATAAALLDAGRGEIFVGKYKFGSPLPLCVEEKLMRPEEFAAEIEQTGQKLAILTPDPHLIETLKKLARDPYLIWPHIIPRPTSADIARIGLDKLLAGKTVSVEALDANYIRRSDAEIFSLPRIAGRG